MFLAPLAWHYYQHTLDVSKMHAAAQCLLSDVPKDLSAFRKARAPAAHTQISVVHISVERALDAPHLVHIEVRASWFVYGMMRLLSSALVQVGSGVMSVAQFQRAVEEGRRQDVKFSAPACGLCLVDVTYPADVDPFLQKGNESDATLLPMGIASCNDPAT